MNVLYDLTPVYSTFGGNHTYSKELHAALSRISDLELQKFAYTRRPGSLSGLTRKLNAAYRDLCYFPLSGRWHSRKVDLIHSTGVPVFNLVPDEKHIITLHDLAILDTPERFTGWSKTYFNKIFQPALKRCRAILTNSQYTKDRLGHYFPELVNKASVTPLAAKSFAHITAEAIPNLPKRFFLFVGSADPAKNLKLIRDSYAEADARGIRLPKTAVVGTANFGVGDDRGFDANLIQLGGVSDEQLKWLYQNCTAFLFPSYYEGFGLPLLEAMSLGAPVVCDRICSLPEVAGDAACYSELEPESFLKAMVEIDQNGVYRSELIKKGKQQVSKFSWPETARITAEVYRSISTS